MPLTPMLKGDRVKGRPRRGEVPLSSCGCASVAVQLPYVARQGWARGAPMPSSIAPAWVALCALSLPPPPAPYHTAELSPLPPPCLGLTLCPALSTLPGSVTHSGG